MIESEIIAKYLIGKLISYTITESRRKDFQRRIPQFSYDFMKVLIHDTINMDFITFDNDITDKNCNSLDLDVERMIFHENRILSPNDYSHIDPPESNRIDRAASTSIKFTKGPKEIAPKKSEPKEKKPNNMNKKVSAMGPELAETKGRPKRQLETKKEEPKQIDLDNILVYEEPPFIAEVRKKKEEEWKKKEEDVKKKQHNEKVRQEEDHEYNKKLKDFEKKNVTADSNGNPIFIKGLTYGLISDFIVTRHGITEKEPVPNVVKTEKSELAKEVVNANKKDEKTAQANVSTVNNKDISVMTNKKDEKKKTILPIDGKGIKGAGAEMKDVKGGGVGFENSKPMPTAQPAGSNYDFFVPNVGVTIKEGTKSKTGGNNFFTLFEKPSVYDYRQLVKDSAQTHYGSSFLHGSEFQKNEITDKMAQTANQLSLPPLLKKTIKDEKSSQMNSNMDTIKVSNKIQSLTSVLDALDQMPEYDKRLEDEHFRSTNSDLFKNKKPPAELEKEKFQENINASLEEINKFNHSIMRNTLWGHGSMNKPKPNTANKIPFKPDQKELEKEMGKTIVNTKLPRSRHLAKVEKMKK